MLDKTILDPEIVKFVDTVTEMLGTDLININTDGSIHCDGSSLLDCFMAVINQAYVVEMLCVNELFTDKQEPVELTEGRELYELSIVDRGGDIYNWSDAEYPNPCDIKSHLSIYFYGYDNSIKVLQELMKLYSANGV